MTEPHSTVGNGYMVTVPAQEHVHKSIHDLVLAERDRYKSLYRGVMSVNHPPVTLLCADPAWSFGDSKPGGRPGSETHYSVQSVEDIMRMPLPPIADDCILTLWRVSSQIEEAYRVVRAWGFRPLTEMVWVKTPKDGMTWEEMPEDAEMHFGMGHSLRGSHETCIIAGRGKYKNLIKNHSIRTVFGAPVGKHSQKPDKFYQLMMKLVGYEGVWAEMHARAPRAGFHCYGNELPTGYAYLDRQVSIDEARTVVEEKVVVAVAAEIPCDTCKETLTSEGTCARCVGMRISDDDNDLTSPFTMEELRNTAVLCAALEDWATIPQGPNQFGYDEAMHIRAYCKTCYEPQFFVGTVKFCVHGHQSDSIRSEYISPYVKWCATCKGMHHESVGCPFEKKEETKHFEQPDIAATTVGNLVIAGVDRQNGEITIENASPDFFVVDCEPNEVTAVAVVQEESPPVTVPESPIPKRRGRPPGSKNRPKTVAQTLADVSETVELEAKQYAERAGLSADPQPESWVGAKRVSWDDADRAADQDLAR